MHLCVKNRQSCQKFGHGNRNEQRKDARPELTRAKADVRFGGGCTLWRVGPPGPRGYSKIYNDKCVILRGTHEHA